LHFSPADHISFALTSVFVLSGNNTKSSSGIGWYNQNTRDFGCQESLSGYRNSFLGQTEAPLLIKAYLEK